MAVCVSQKGSMPRQLLKQSLSPALNRLSESLEGTRVEIGNKIQPFLLKVWKGFLRKIV